MGEDDRDGVVMHGIRMREKGVRERERDEDEMRMERFSGVFGLQAERRERKRLRGRRKEVTCLAPVGGGLYFIFLFSFGLMDKMV